jgi:hypothetical protein
VASQWPWISGERECAIGIHLFDAVEGDHSTILGLPLLPLLARLRGRGLLAARMRDRMADHEGFRGS